jgi:hypothetical protein
MALGFHEPATCEGTDFRAAEAFEQRHAAIPMRAAGGFGADEHQF